MNLSTAMPPWYDEGVCSKLGDADHVFHSDAVDLVADAKEACGYCPVRVRCLEHALANPTVSGIWGGTTHRERNQLLAARGRICNHTGCTRPLPQNAVTHRRKCDLHVSPPKKKAAA